MKLRASALDSSSTSADLITWGAARVCTYVPAQSPMDCSLYCPGPCITLHCCYYLLTATTNRQPSLPHLYIDLLPLHTAVLPSFSRRKISSRACQSLVGQSHRPSEQSGTGKKRGRYDPRFNRPNILIGQHRCQPRVDCCWPVAHSSEIRALLDKTNHYGVQTQGLGNGQCSQRGACRPSR